MPLSGGNTFKAQLSLEARAPFLTALRAQLSLETLLVFLVFLSLLALSYSVASKVGAASQNKAASELALASFNSLSSSIESACIGGNGNIRTAEIKGGKAALSSEGKKLRFESGNFNTSEEFGCEIEVLSRSLSGSFKITNNGGTIEIS
ncbi:MAG: hypothetical protein QW568_02645 [Candidatus Anstonellaceae archaeon]